MRTIIQIKFDAPERAVLSRVMSSLEVGFPGYPYDRADPRSAMLRAVTGVARSGAQMGRSVLLQAQEGLQVQRDKCRVESDLTYWRVTLLQDPKAVRTSVTKAKGRVTLVSDPERMCEYLAEMRTVQLRESEAALALISKALTIATTDDEEADRAAYASLLAED